MSTLCPQLARIFSAVLLSLALALPASASQSEALPAACRTLDRITVYAAASLGPVLKTFDQLLAENGGPRLVISLASSSVLARQIENGAPADIFLSADKRWADYLRAADMLRPEPPVVIARNRLVLALQGKHNPAAHPDNRDFASLLLKPEIRRIATGDPGTVPLGGYAREWLQALGLWDEIRDNLLPALNARAALRFFETGAADAAILYASDTRGSAMIGTAFVLPENLHSPINYWALAPKNNNEAGYRCLSGIFLAPWAAGIWKRSGFEPMSHMY